MQPETANPVLDSFRSTFATYRGLAERALIQVDDDEFFRVHDPEANSLAIVVKHMAGNLRSRWRDFLTTDGEKPDRHRDQEFELTDADDRASLMAAWNAGWGILENTLGDLRDADLEKTITIRQEPHSVILALCRGVTHYAYHAGQIAQLARHYRGEDWQTLSVAKGGTKAFNEQMRERFQSSSESKS